MSMNRTIITTQCFSAARYLRIIRGLSLLSSIKCFSCIPSETLIALALCSHPYCFKTKSQNHVFAPAKSITTNPCKWAHSDVCASMFVARTLLLNVSGVGQCLGRQPTCNSIQHQSSFPAISFHCP